MASLHPASQHRGPNAKGWIVIWRDPITRRQRWKTYPTFEAAQLIHEEVSALERDRSPKFTIRLNVEYKQLTRHNYVCAALEALLVAQGWEVYREHEYRPRLAREERVGHRPRVDFRVDLYATRGQESCVIEVGNLQEGRDGQDVAHRRRALERLVDWFVHIPYDSPLFAVLSLGAVAPPPDPEAEEVP
jgi:hypothetical protein